MTAAPVARIGFLINPIAGMGGRVGLKGTDGVVAEARARGAEVVAAERAREALVELVRLLRSASTRTVHWVACSGSMGEEALQVAGIDQENITVVHDVAGEPSAADTKQAATKFLDAGVDLVLFCGGDGTARDICSVVETRVPILGIPSGVKMYSGVFGTNPTRTAQILLEFLQGKLTIVAVDILDLDEEQYRSDAWHIRLYASAVTPYEPTYTQSAKALIEETVDAEAKADIAATLQEEFEDADELLVLLGSGSTVKSVADRMGLEKTLLGIDAVAGGRVIASDLNERRILEILACYPTCRLVLSPIGSQGFVLGRGNLQLSPAVIRAIGPDHITVIATPAKLQRTPTLRFDTNDPELDRQLTRAGYIPVVTGYRRRRMVKVAI